MKRNPVRTHYLARHDHRALEEARRRVSVYLRSRTYSTLIAIYSPKSK
jgi:hypothetical protein